MSDPFGNIFLISRKMENNPNKKMEHRLQLLMLLVFLTTASTVAQSSEEFTEAVVRKRRNVEMLRS